MNDSPPHINYEVFDYPSDRITLKQIRALQSDIYAKCNELEVLHLSEKEFANLGFAVGLGSEAAIEHARLQITGWNESEDGPYDETRELQKARQSLAQAYVRFGLADGPESAAQMIRRLEDQGAAQAKLTGGRNR